MKQLLNNWLWILGALCAVGLSTLDPIAQDPTYHTFADQKCLFGIHNFHNVWTNFPFALLGIMGLWSIKNINPKGLEFQMAFVLYIGFILVGLGSSFYHYNPNNFGLLWDRLPMTIIFISFYAMIVNEGVGYKSSKYMFYMGVPLAILTVIYWYFTEYHHQGDLRPYVFIQFFPLMSIPVILFVRRRSFRNLKTVGMVILFYVVAKLLEHFDFEIQAYINYSGHALKHLASAVAVYYMLVFVKQRYETQ